VGGPGPHERQLRDFGLAEEDLRAWWDSGLAADAFEGWLTDRVARRPTGERARAVYGDEQVHDFARSAILAALCLRAGDRLLEIGCGGGLLLRDALAQGASAVGVDHSEDMVSLARERAPGAQVLLAPAEQMPFGEGRFTAVAMSVVFFFFAHPWVVLEQCRRVLAPGGRLALFTTGPELRGTPAAPEPIAKFGHFYTDEQLAQLARESGFTGVLVANDGGGQLLTASV
jgi:SAM-dependent methyltransferase